MTAAPVRPDDWRTTLKLHRAARHDEGGQAGGETAPPPAPPEPPGRPRRGVPYDPRVGRYSQPLPEEYRRVLRLALRERKAGVVAVDTHTSAPTLAKAAEGIPVSETTRAMVARWLERTYPAEFGLEGWILSPPGVACSEEQAIPPPPRPGIGPGEPSFADRTELLAREGAPREIVQAMADLGAAASMIALLLREQGTEPSAEALVAGMRLLFDRAAHLEEIR